jgi:hypothetical protein
MSLLVKLGLDSSGFKTGLAQVENSVTGFASKLGGILTGVVGFEAIRRGFESAIEKGDQLQDIAEKFGVSASKLQMLGNAASVYGSSIEAVSAGLNKLSLAQQKALAGDANLQDTFREVGISLQDLKNIGPEDLFLRIADSFASGANDGRQFIIVNELLGKAQTDLIKVMNQGSAAIIEQGNSMGVWSDETIAALSAASDALKTLQNNFTIFFGNLSMGINKAVERYQDLIEAVYLHIRANRDENLDAAGRASLYEQSAVKAGDVIFGRSKIQMTNAGPTSIRAQANQIDEQRIKELQKLDTEAARFELRLIEARIDGRRKAEKIMENFEEQNAKDQARNAQERARLLASITQNVESLVAEREGPRAELELQKRRAAEAAQAARETGTPEQILAANQEANRLQRMLESRLENLGFGDASLSRARMQAQQITGMVPGVESLRDIMTKPDVSQPQKIQVDRLPLSDVLQRLDDLIRSAGKFGT